MEAIILALIALLGVREYLAYKERERVYDRLMSKTITEYKDNDKPEDNHFEEEETDLLPIDAAKEEIVYGEEE